MRVPHRALALAPHLLKSFGASSPHKGQNYRAMLVMV
jgi:hypothetical protein